MEYKKLLEELYSTESRPFKLDLVPVRTLASQLGNPQDKIPCIHVAGTNGKGSTCHFLFSMLSAAGYKVGLYTSPHLHAFNERIRVGDELISDEKVVELYLKVKEVEQGQSFFELTTMMAFLYFAECKCDIMIIETGLGGRLDATNIVTPLVSVITTLGFDHMQFLGDTIEKIAFEKAGIIKENVPVVIMKGEGNEVVESVAKEKNADIFYNYDYLLVNALTNDSLKQKSLNKSALKGKTLKLENYGAIDFPLSLPAYQQQNIALAVKTISVLSEVSSFSVSEKGVQKGINSTKIPARFEWKSQTLLLDCAHNVAGMETLVSELKQIDDKKVCVIALMKDKDIEQMLKVLDSAFDFFVFTTVDHPRCSEPKELAKHVTKPFMVEPDAHLAVEKVQGMKGITVVTGSVLLSWAVLRSMVAPMFPFHIEHIRSNSGNSNPE